MTKIKDGEARDKKRQKARYGHKVGSKSVLLIQEILYNRAVRIAQRKRKRRK